MLLHNVNTDDIDNMENMYIFNNMDNTDNMTNMAKVTNMTNMTNVDNIHQNYNYIKQSHIELNSKNEKQKNIDNELKEQQKKEEIFKEMLQLKDLDFLLEKKLFYKNQLTYLYDMELQIEKFKKQINTELSNLQSILLKKCDHDWMKCTDGSYDEHPDYICVICESEYR